MPTPDPEPPPPSPPSGKLDLDKFGLPELNYANNKTTEDLLVASTSIILGDNDGDGTDDAFPRNGSNSPVFVPSSQDGDRIYGFNNPNKSIHPAADTWSPHQKLNNVGYFTYVQFLMDWGADRSPEVDNGTNGNIIIVTAYINKYHVNTSSVGIGSINLFPWSELRIDRAGLEQIRQFEARSPKQANPMIFQCRTMKNQTESFSVNDADMRNSP